MTANGSAALDWKSYANTIDGKLVGTKQTRHGIDPNTAEPLAEVPLSTQEDVDTAVKAARKAFPAWRALSYDDRAEYLNKFADALQPHEKDFIEMLGKESGKPVNTATTEFAFTIGVLRVISQLRIEDETIIDEPERSAVVRHTPLGIGAGLVPWNWPLLLGTGKLVSALLTGNTFIMKPSPFTPYCNLKLGEIGKDIFPPGVFQVLSGGDDLGPMLTEHPDIDKISFTGSTATGKRVMESCSRTLKRVTLEMGGNDPTIVCADADLDKAVGKIGVMSFLSSGQICMDVKRIYVHESIYDEFKEKLVGMAKGFKVGPAEDAEVMVGPIQNSMQFEKVQDMYSEIAKQGWSALLGAAVHERSSKGFFVHPEIIDNPPEDSRIVQEEPFGPIVPLLKFRDEDEAIRRANATKMGLGASVWSKDIQRAQKIAMQLEAGSVWVNTHFELAPNVPFGGHKWSGLGMEWGVVGLKGWCNTQSLWTRKD